MGRGVQYVGDHVVKPEAEKAIFLVGSLPLGMATSASDIDFVVIVNSREDLLSCGNAIANSDQSVAFSNESNLLLAKNVIAIINGLSVDVSVAIASGISDVRKRLRRQGPELSESEIMILSRLGTGWLLWQSEGYLEQNGIVLADPALDVYCATRSFVFALIFRRKALKALDLEDKYLALHLGRLSVEMAYLAYFASEGFSYLGPKWLAQIGTAFGAPERLRRHPLLKQGIHLLFPSFDANVTEAVRYLERVSKLLSSMRSLIEQKRLFEIAFRACPQIAPIE